MGWYIFWMCLMIIEWVGCDCFGDVFEWDIMIIRECDNKVFKKYDEID
jgi:hypothetical protein